MFRRVVGQSSEDVYEIRDEPEQPVRSGASVSDMLLSLFCLIIFPLVTTFEDDLRPWMISRSTASGLFSRQSPPESFVQPTVPHAPWKFLVLHHSGTESGSVQTIHAQHLRRRDSSGNPWKGIGYHFVIGNGSGMRDGAVEATFRWKQQLHGAHAGNALYNARGIGVCLIGNFETAPPTSAQLSALQTLLVQLCSHCRIAPADILGHSAVRRTACPGRLFPLQRIKLDVTQALPAPSPP
ncbi:MAG: peptidoglycan recognition family protein [Planctomycetota bacterium]